MNKAFTNYETAKEFAVSESKKTEQQIVVYCSLNTTDYTEFVVIDRPTLRPVLIIQNGQILVEKSIKEPDIKLSSGKLEIRKPYKLNLGYSETKKNKPKWH